jgi:predicted phosphate transport protein (TIGR00153 family)
VPLHVMPRRNRFFVLFRENAATLMEGLEALQALLNGAAEAFGIHAENLRDLEHQADEITHRITRELNHSFITPFDRDDIYALASALDDVIDLVEEIADTIVLDGIQTITPEAQQMGHILIQIGRELVTVFDQLESKSDTHERWIRIHTLENQADEVTRGAIGELFNSLQDPIEVIRWKDVYALLEETVDRAEDIANILETVTIKNS